LNSSNQAILHYQQAVNVVHNQRRILNAIVLVAIISSCSVKQEQKNEPMRAKGIPEKAFWVGGTDDGNWYLVEDIHSHKNNATIKVYNDLDGSLIVSKRFVLVCSADNQIWIEDLKQQINCFDGKKILLKSPNGKMPCYLQ
jgi:hypothetical protein